MLTTDIERAAEALGDEDATVRRVAVLDLTEAADDETIAPLLIGALRDSDAEVRAEAARGLAGIERADAVAAVAPLLFDVEPHVREAAAESLAELKDPALAEYLLPLVENEDDFVRAAILRAIRPLRRPESL